MKKDVIKLSKKYEFKPEKCPFTIYGRIYQITDSEGEIYYTGTLSHLWKPTNNANNTYRTSFTSKKFETVEREIKAYIATYSSVGVVENENFDYDL